MSVGFTFPPDTQPLGNPDAAARGIEAVPSLPFEGQDWFGLEKQIGRAIDYGNQRDDTLGRTRFSGITGQTSTPAPMLSATETNQQYGDIGLNFTGPVPAATAAEMAAAKRAELVREDIARRAPDGLINNAERFGAGFVTSALDPLNIAASFVPVVGQARYVAMLRGAGDSVGRALVRFGIGAAQNAAGQVPLEAARYGLTRNEQGDYDATNAMLDIAYGSLLGGGLHVAGGFVHDLVRGAPAPVGNQPAPDPLTEKFTGSPQSQLVANDIAARETALRVSLAQMADGRPVEVHDALSLLQAQKAAQEFRNWMAANTLVSGETDDALQAASKQENLATRHEAAASAASDHIEQLQSSMAQLQDEMAPVRNDLTADFGTQDRLQAIDDELAKPGVPAARAADLQAERQMVTSTQSPDALALNVARLQAQLSGLEAEHARTESQIPPLTQKALTNSTAASTVRAAADTQFTRLSRRIDSRRDVTLSLGARTIRRYAGAIGVRLATGEDVTIAKSILEGPKRGARERLDAALKEIASRRGGPALEDTTGNEAAALRAFHVGGFSDDVQARADALRLSAAMERARTGLTPEHQRLQALVETAQKTPADPGHDIDAQLQQLEAAVRGVPAQAVDRNLKTASGETMNAGDQNVASGTSKLERAEPAVVLRGDELGDRNYDLEKGELPSVNPQVPEPSIEGTGGLATREAPTEEINPGNQPVNLDVASALNPAQLDNELSNAEQQLTRAEALNKALAQAVSCMLGQGGL